jgi:hypothetical protein
MDFVVGGVSICWYGLWTCQPTEWMTGTDITGQPTESMTGADSTAVTVITECCNLYAQQTETVEHNSLHKPIGI